MYMVELSNIKNILTIIFSFEERKHKLRNIIKLDNTPKFLSKNKHLISLISIEVELECKTINVFMYKY